MVLAVSTMLLSIFTASARAQGASETLYALNAMPASSLSPFEAGRYFDAALRRPGLPAPPVVLAEPPRPQPRPPFVVAIPAPGAYARTFRRLLRGRQADRYDALIGAQSRERGLDPRLVKAIVAAESEFCARARSSAGALGLMQVMPETAAAVGVEGGRLFEPAANIRAGTAYLAHLFARAWKRYHLQGLAYSAAPPWLVQRVIAAYNAGPRFLAHRRLYRQTRDYVMKVLLFYKSAVADLRGRQAD